MSTVRVLAGTRKGAFVLTSDAQRKDWQVTGPHFAGWEIYHVVGSPADPNRLYASQSTGWFGQLIQRSDDGGQTWEPVGNEFAYDGVPGTHQWYDGTQHPWEFKRVWHLEPSLTDPDTGLRRCRGRRHVPHQRRRQELAGAGRPAQRQGQPLGARRRRNVPAHHRARPDEPQPHLYRHLGRRRLPHRRRRRDLAAHQPRPEFPTTSCRMPTPTSATASTASPCTPPARASSSCKSTGTSCAATIAGDLWHEISGNLPSDFGFPIAVHAHEPETVYVVPIKSDSEHYPPDGKLRVYRSRTGGNEWEALTNGLPQSDCYVNVLRNALAVDTLDACGIYVGTTGGQIYASADSGDTWAPIVRDLPPVLSVEVQVLP